MNSPMEIAEHWEEATFKFIESARALAASQIPFSTLHIIIRALDDQPSDQLTVTPLIKLLDDDLRRECRAAIRVQLALYGETKAGPDGMTEATAQFFSQWNEDALKREVKVTIPFIIWHILNYDRIIQTTFITLDNEIIEKLTRSLEHQFAPLYVSSNSSITVTNPEAAHQYAPKVTDEMFPSSELPGNIDKKLLYVNMHAVLMSNILNILGNLDKHQIAILSGMYGTPLYNIDEALADVLKQGDYSVSNRPRLARRYSKVYRMDIVGLLSAVIDEATPPQILRAVLEEAESNNAILIVKNMQAFNTNDERERMLLKILADSGNLILGLFETGVHDIDSPREALDLESIVEIAARTYLPGQTKDLIKEYYLPHWKNRTSYTFTDDAFDLVIELEPGAWINLKRKTLPYLAVGIGEDTIQTVQGGKALIRETAQMAIGALDELKNEAATAESLYRKRFQPILDEARIEIEKVLASPLPDRDGTGKYVLTRGHVTAQLICPNDSEFHFPGYGPAQLMHSRKRDLPGKP